MPDESRTRHIIEGVDKLTPVQQKIVKNIQQGSQKIVGVWRKEGDAYVRTVSVQRKARKQNEFSIKKLQTALHRVAEQQKMNDLTSRRATQTIKKATKATRDHGEEKRRMRVRTEGLRREMGRMRNTLLLIAFAWHTVQRFVMNNVKTFAEFEQSLVNIQVMMEKDAIPTIARFENQIEDLARTYGVATSELTQAMFDTYSATQDVAKSQKILTAGTKLAIAGNAKLAVTVKALITLMEAYGKRLKGAEDAWHLLFAMQVKARATVAEMSEEVGKFLPLADKLGISAEEIGASYARLTVGLGDTSEAATAMRGILIALFKPSKDLQKMAQRQYGTTIQRAVAEKGLISILGKLEKAEVEQLGTMVRRVRALTGLTILTSNLNRLRSDARDLADRQTLAEEALEAQMTTTERQMKILTEHWRDFMRAMGEVEARLLPLKKVAGAMRGIAEAMEFWKVVSPKKEIRETTFFSEELKSVWYDILHPVEAFRRGLRGIKRDMEGMKVVFRPIGEAAYKKYLKYLQDERKWQEVLFDIQTRTNQAREASRMPLSNQVEGLDRLGKATGDYATIANREYLNLFKTHARLGGETIDLEKEWSETRKEVAEENNRIRTQWEGKWNDYLEKTTQWKIDQEYEYHREILASNALTKTQLEQEEERHIARLAELGEIKLLKWKDIEKKTTEFRMRELQINYERFLQMGEDEVEVARWYNEAITKIIESSGERWIKLYNNVFTSMQKTMSDVFFDAMEQELKTANDYWQVFAKSIKKLWADLITSMIIEWAKTKVFRMFLRGVSVGIGGGAGGGGGLSSIAFAKSGGLIEKNRIKKYQEGGVVPILAHEGEGVLSKRGMAALGADNLARLNRGEQVGGQQITNYLVIQTIDAQSFREKLAENSDLFTATIYGEIEGAYPLRNLVRRLGT